MNDVTFETMRQTHVADVLAIEREVFSTPWTRDMFLQEVRDSGFSRSFVALSDGRIVGYCVSWFLQREVHLLNIAVLPSRQREGIGSAMLRFLIDLARRQCKDLVTLEVREGNEAAIRLYRSFGFAEVGVRRGYYSDDKENALLMARALDPPPRKVLDDEG